MNLFDAHKDMVEWMAAFGQETPAEPCLPPEQILELRHDLIDEEVCEETLPELRYFMHYGGKGNFVNYEKLIDGLADTLFVVIGTFVALGVPTEEVYKEVSRSNWTKLWTSSEWEQQTTKFRSNHSIEKVSGNYEFRHWLVKNDIGKVIKSPSFSPPNFDKWIPKNLKK